MAQQQPSGAALVERDPNVLGGLPVFAGTRVPVRALFEHLEAGDSIETFVADYPDVTPKQAAAVLEAAEQRLLA